jgi:hypothetical protein
VRVSKTTSSSTRSEPTISVMIQVVKQVTCCSIKDLCSNWNSNYEVLAFASGPIRTFTMQTALRRVVRVVTKVQQRVERSIGQDDYIAAAPAITAGWTTARDKLFTPESCNTVTSVPPLYVNLGAINEHPKNRKRRLGAQYAAQASRTFSKLF